MQGEALLPSVFKRWFLKSGRGKKYRLFGRERAHLCFLDVELDHIFTTLLRNTAQNIFELSNKLLSSSVRLAVGYSKGSNSTLEQKCCNPVTSRVPRVWREVNSAGPIKDLGHVQADGQGLPVPDKSLTPKVCDMR